MLFEKLTHKDKETIKKYIEDFGWSNYAVPQEDLSFILRHWDFEKRKIFELLGNKLIHSEKITYQKPKNAIRDEVRKLLDKSPFVDWLRSVIPYHFSYCGNEEQEHLYWAVRGNLLDVQTLANNQYEGVRYDIKFSDYEKVIQLQNGAKPIKILKKIVDLIGGDNEKAMFEQFRLEHSMILNQKTLEGELVLSIHPMDFLTMSDNGYNWSSCMSWTDPGSYRAGTVEMMNSPYVLVAYLKGDEPYTFHYGDLYGQWSDKKWRELFIVHDKIITNVKGYPYRTSILSKAALKMIHRLAEENLEYFNYNDEIIRFETSDEVWEPDDANYSFEFATGTMYNDFDSAVHFCFLDKDVDDEVYVNYSGVRNCMWCGEEHHSGYYDYGEDPEGNVICENCIESYHCDYCDCSVSSADIYEIDGQNLCEYCYENHTIWTVDDGVHLEENTTRLYLTTEGRHPSEFNGGYFITMYDVNSRHFKRKFGVDNYEEVALGKYPLSKYVPVVYIENLSKEQLEIFSIFNDGEYQTAMRYFNQSDPEVWWLK